MSFVPHTLLSISRQTSAEVFHANHWGVSWGKEVIDELKEVALRSQQSKARLCLHPLPSDSHQEMLIVMSSKALELPQRRRIGGESAFDTKIAIEGWAILRYYGADRTVSRSVELGDNHARYVHTRSDEFHSLLIMSDWFVYLEVLEGPFDSRTTEVAPWLLED